MKKIKQTLSLILAVLMLITAVPMQSITAVDEKSIEVSAVEFVDDMPISMKYVEFIKHDQDCESMVPMGVYGTMDYVLDITFSDGRKVRLSAADDSVDVSISVLVDYDECRDAILNGDDTVNVYIYLYRESLYYECTLQKKIVPGIIKSMEPITILPSVIYGCDITHNSYWIPDLYDVYEKHLFKAEYYDGTVAFVECGKEKDKVNLDFEHGGYWEDDVYEVSSWVTFTFYDEIIFKNVELVECYKEVELVDCKFVDSKLEEISFKLYRTDGAMESYTETVDVNRMGYTDLNRIYGYDVGIYYGNSGSSFKTDDKLYVELCIGKITDKLFFAPEDVCSCKICHYKGIKFIYFSIISLFWKLLKINQYCDCGMKHW